MKIPDQLIRVSRASILGKTFNVTEEEIRAKLTGADLTKALAELPTEEERQWMEIFESTMPELARLKRKISVCLDAEVSELTDDCVSYTYGENTFRLEMPRNAYKICMAIEKDVMSAVAEMCAQRCVKMNGKVIGDIKKDGVMLVDEMQLLVRIASKFFFQIF